LLACELAGAVGVAQPGQGFGRLDAPAGEHGMTAAELVPARGRLHEVGVGIGGALLGEPETGAALQDHRGAEDPGGQVIGARRRQDRFGRLRLIKLDKGVEQEIQCVQHGRARRHGELGVEGEAGVCLGVARLSGAGERHGAQLAPVG